MKTAASPFRTQYVLALAQLGECIRTTSDPAELVYQAGGILGETLQLNRAGYGTIDTVNETILIERDWRLDGYQSIAGMLHFRDYGSYINDLKSGRTVVIADTFQDPRTIATADSLQGIDVRAFVNMPVSEGGDFVALLFLTDAQPRVWREDEIALMREFAERMQVGVARLVAETRLRASEARFEAITNSIDHMVWSTLPDGFHDYFNQRWYEYTGVPAGTTDGEGWADLFHPDDQARTWARWRRSLETGEPYQIEYRLRHRSGRYRWVMGRAQPVRDRHGRITRWYGTCTEIEDMVAAREVLARSRTELERLVEARTAERNRLWSLTNLLLAVISFETVFRAVNPAWPAVLGWSAAELLGERIDSFVHPEDLARTHEWMRQAAAGLLTGEIENRFRCRDGSFRSISWSIAAHNDAFHCVGRDVTAEREQSAALALAEATLRQSQKMEAVGQLTGGIAHDFNNMLAIVIGSLDLLERRIPAGEAPLRRYTEAAREGARRAAALTQRLLAFSRQQPLQPEPIDVNRLVAGMSELIRGSMGADIRLETVLAAGMWPVHADPNQLENVLLNLAVNARDAMPEGGRLTIETQNAHLDERYAAAHLGVPAGQYVMVAVSDTGTGMSRDVMDKAFDPFFTTKGVGKGTGLGLSQTYGFVKQSGGHVKIYSEPGQGTSVKVYLPRLVNVAEAGTTAPAPEIRTIAGDSAVVLVVEDEAGVRRVSVDALVELGYQVLEADSAEAALRVLAQHRDVALLFTDVVMPDQNGARLADQVRRLYPQVKILFTTGYTRNAVVHNGVLDPGVFLIGKPFTLDALGAKVREVLDT